MASPQSVAPDDLRPSQSDVEPLSSTARWTQRRPSRSEYAREIGPASARPQAHRPLLRRNCGAPGDAQRIGSCYLPRVNARIESGRCVLIPQMYNPASLPVFHMSGELFKMMVGIDVPHVPYSDADADRSARRSGAGHLQHMPELIGHLSSGRLRLLAVSANPSRPPRLAARLMYLRLRFVMTFGSWSAGSARRSWPFFLTLSPMFAAEHAAAEELRKVTVVSFGLFGHQGVFRREATSAA